MKDTGLRIRVQRDLRDRFVHVCQAQDKPAAQVLREFMRTYVDEHQALLADTPPTSSSYVQGRIASGNDDRGESQ